MSGVDTRARLGERAEGRVDGGCISSGLVGVTFSYSLSFDDLRGSGITTLPSASCGDRDAGIWLPLRCRLEGIPRAEARLLAIDEVRSRCGDGMIGEEW